MATKVAAPKFDESHFNFASYMFAKIQKLNPRHKAPNLSNWAKEIRLLIERDKRTKDEVLKVFDFANSHHFWQSNILSPKTLRKHFDKLLIEMNKPAKETAENETSGAWFDEMMNDGQLDELIEKGRL